MFPAFNFVQLTDLATHMLQATIIERLIDSTTHIHRRNTFNSHSIIIAS